MKGAILCVDDERVIAVSLLEQLWEHFGDEYVYEMAMSGEEALEIIDDLTNDGSDLILIISDWLMNGMKGDELLIRIHQKYPQTHAIMLSGQADPSAVERAVKEGALNAFVSKPWDKAKLMQKISDLIEV